MKVAISVPDPVFEAAERLAKQRGLPRSQLFTEALEYYLSKHGSAAVTDQLNAVYALEESGVERAMAHAQFRSVADEAW